MKFIAGLDKIDDVEHTLYHSFGMVYDRDYHYYLTLSGKPIVVFAVNDDRFNSKMIAFLVLKHNVVPFDNTL